MLSIGNGLRRWLVIGLAVGLSLFGSVVLLSPLSPSVGASAKKVAISRSRGTAIASAIPLSSPSCIEAVAVPQSGGTIKAVGDYVHVSTTQASGHGWWDYVSGTMPPNGVTVTVTLQVYLTLPVCAGYYDVTTSKGVVYSSGGGSGNRVTARATCTSKTPKMWRSVVTVVVNTVTSSVGSVATSPQTLKCTP